MCIDKNSKQKYYVINNKYMTKGMIMGLKEKSEENEKNESEGRLQNLTYN